MAARPMLILHAGTGRTATTSQQHCLFRDREALSARGLLYLDSQPFLGGSRRAHDRVARLLARDGAPSAELIAFKRGLLARAADHDVVLVSACGLWEHALRWPDTPRDLANPAFAAARRAYLEKVAAFFGDFDVHPLVYLRDVESYAHSCYKEGVFASAQRRRFADDVKEHAQRFDYDRQLALFDAVFDRPARVRSFDDAKKAGVYAALLFECGLTPPAGSESVEARVSPANAATLWATGPRLSGGTPDELLAAFARSEEGRHLFEGHETTLWPDEKTHRAFAARFRSERAPATNADPDAPPAINPWGLAEQARAEATFAAWAAGRALASIG